MRLADRAENTNGHACHFFMTPVLLDASSCDFVIVEDEALLRELIELTLQAWFRPRESVAYPSIRAALQAMGQRAPQVLVTDLSLPDGDGRELIREARRRGLDTRVIVLTGRVDSTLPAELIALGVAGLVEKSLASTELKIAIDRVLRGGLYYSTSSAPKPSLIVATAPAAASADTLNAREREITRMVASGLSSKEVAVRMSLAPRTVEKIRAEIMEKLEVRDFAGLVRWCVQNGIV